MTNDIETATPKQDAENPAKFYNPDAGQSLPASDQAAAEEQFRKITGEPAPKPNNKTTKK